MMAEISWADKLLNFLGTGNTGVSFAQEYGYRGYANTLTNSVWSSPATIPSAGAAATSPAAQQGSTSSQQQGSSSIPTASGTTSVAAQSGAVSNGTRRTKTDYWDGLPGPVGGTVEWQNGYWYIAISSNQQSSASPTQAQQGSAATQGSSTSQSTASTNTNQSSTGSQPTTTSSGQPTTSSGSSLPFNSYGSDSIVPSLNYAGYSSSPTSIYNPAATPASVSGGSSSPVIGISASGQGSASSLYAGLITQYQQAQNNAYAANESRFQQALSASQDRYTRGIDIVNTLGQQQVTDINRQFDQGRGSVIQNAVGRGIYNTTALDAMLRGNEQNRQTSLNAASSQRTAMRLNVDAMLSGDVLGLIERRQDVYPSWEGLTSLAAAYGQSQMAGAGAAAIAANQNNYVNQQQGAIGTAGLIAGVNGVIGATGRGGNVGGGGGGFTFGGSGGTGGAGGGGGGGSASSAGGMAYESWMRDFRQFDSLYEDWTGGDQILRGKINTNDKATPSDGYMSVGAPGTSTQSSTSAAAKLPQQVLQDAINASGGKNSIEQQNALVAFHKEWFASGKTQREFAQELKKMGYGLWYQYDEASH